MKNLLKITALVAASFGFTSCCSMFGIGNQSAGYRTETRQVKTCHYDIVTEEIRVADGSKSGTIQTIEKKVPRYKTVTKKYSVPCPRCTRYYCPKKDCCGTTSESTMKLSSVQGPVGSPHMGLIPTMKPLAP